MTSTSATQQSQTKIYGSNSQVDHQYCTQSLPVQGSKKVPSDCPGQVHVDFPVGQVTFHSHLPNGQGPRQVICQLN